MTNRAFLAYAWEAAFTTWTLGGATPAQLREAVALACRLYRVPAPTVHLATRNTHAGKKLESYYDPNVHHIVLRPRHHEIGTALHEAAHAITDYLLGQTTDAHGAEWLGVFIYLLDRFKVAPRAGLEAHARKLGLKFEPANKTSPRFIRSSHSRAVASSKKERAA